MPTLSAFDRSAQYAPGPSARSGAGQAGFRRVARFERRAPAAREGVGHAAKRLGRTQTDARQFACAAKKSKIGWLQGLPELRRLAAKRLLRSDSGLLFESQARLFGESRA